MSKRTHADALQTKRNILEAANRIFSVKGFAKASLSDIAREANVTRGAIYWHFENKSEILVELIEDQTCRLNLSTTLRAAADQNQKDPLGMLKQWAMLIFKGDASSIYNSALLGIIDGIMASDEDSEARARMSEFIHGRRLLVETALRNAIALKQLPADMDVELATSYIRGTLNGLITYIRHASLDVPLTRCRVIVDSLFHQISELRIIEGAEGSSTHGADITGRGSGACSTFPMGFHHYHD